MFLWKNIIFKKTKLTKFAQLTGRDRRVLKQNPNIVRGKNCKYINSISIFLPEPGWAGNQSSYARFLQPRLGSKQASKVSRRADQSELRNGGTNSEGFARRSTMANVIDQDQQWLINCLSATLDPNQEVRSFAEASLNQASLQPGSCFWV